MIGYEIYKLVHFLGLFILFCGLGCSAAWMGLGVSADGATKLRKRGAMLHGIGLFLMLVGGFGMLARLGISWPFPGWIIAKLTFWLLMGGLLAVVKKRALSPGLLLTIACAIGVASAIFAIYKPFAT